MSERGAATAAERTPARRATGRWRGLAISLGLGAVILAGLLWSLRSTILTRYLRSALHDRGIDCGPVEVSASALLGELEVSAASCEVGEGPIAQVTWDAPVVLTMEGGALTSAVAQRVRVTRRRRPGDDTVLADLLHAPERVAGVLHFASRLSLIDSPRIEVERVEVSREGAEAPELTISRLSAPRREASAPVDAAIEQIELAVLAGPLGAAASPRLSEVAVRAEGSRGSLRGTLDTTVEVPLLGTLRLGQLMGPQRLVIEAEALDSPSPRWSVRTQD